MFALSTVATFFICGACVYYKASARPLILIFLPLCPVFSSSSPLSSFHRLSLSPSLSHFFAVACNDLVASGRDRKPNALVQVAVIDPHKQHLVTQACTEIVEVRPLTHTHTQTHTHTETRPPSSPCLSLTFDVCCFASPLGHLLLVGVRSISVCPFLSLNFFLFPIWVREVEQTMRINLLLLVIVESQTAMRVWVGLSMRIISQHSQCAFVALNAQEFL